jgi:DNA/RNA-binding domain of Phe-tRNA-synthetase-like protein
VAPNGRAVEIVLTDEFRAAFPAGVFGALEARRAPNRPAPAALGPRLRAIEAELRQRFAADPLEHDAVARPYVEYFRRYGNRYPVVHQARTILSGQPIASPSALVAAMFGAEVASLVLTSGHDRAALAGVLRVDAARDGDRYVKINGKEQSLKAGDMVVRDDEGIIACVLYGPDFRTRLRDDSAHALYGAWCPVGIASDVARTHLEMLASLVRVEWPDAEIEAPRLFAA